MSLVSWLTPWKPATSAMAPSSSASRIRPGVTSMIRALPWLESVMTPACEPVNERASAPSVEIAMASSAIGDPLAGGEQHVQLAAGRVGGDLLARSSSSSVVSPIAETTTTTSLPFFFAARRSARPRA